MTGQHCSSSKKHGCSENARLNRQPCGEKTYADLLLDITQNQFHMDGRSRSTRVKIKLCDLRAGKYFFKGTDYKRKRFIDYNKIKSFCSLKDTIKRVPQT